MRTERGVIDASGDVVLSNAHLFRWYQAAWDSPFRGKEPPKKGQSVLTTAILEPGRLTSLALTFDIGYHASGWWKNAEYDKCLHLSLTHVTEQGIESCSDAEVKAWTEAIFEDHAHKVWIEPPASTFDPHRLPGVAHVRLFLDDDLQPIIPKGEVYDLKPWPYGKAAESIGGDVR